MKPLHEALMVSFQTVPWGMNTHVNLERVTQSTNTQQIADRFKQMIDVLRSGDLWFAK